MVEGPTNEGDLAPKELKALAKARRPWYRKKRFWALGTLGLLVIASLVTGGAGDAEDVDKGPRSPGAKTSETRSSRLFPGRAGAQREDKERNIGEAAELAGYTATVMSAGFRQSLGAYEEDGYVVVDVTLLNRDKGAQHYNVFDWRIQTPTGQVLDPTNVGAIEWIGSGDLVQGGTVTGAVVFEVGAQRGDFFIIYKPDPFNAIRAIWKVVVP